MSTRCVHIIHSECDIYVQRLGAEVRLRITEKNPELTNPTDIEIEGDPKHIAEALATCAAVLANIGSLDEEPN